MVGALNTLSGLRMRAMVLPDRRGGRAIAAGPARGQGLFTPAGRTLVWPMPATPDLGRVLTRDLQRRQTTITV